MAKEARKQIELNMRATLYDDLAKLAKDNGQTTTYVLEQAAHSVCCPNSECRASRDYGVRAPVRG